MLFLLRESEKDQGLVEYGLLVALLIVILAYVLAVFGIEAEPCDILPFLCG